MSTKTAKPERTPTDAALMKAFTKYEESLNVALSLLRTAPEKSGIFDENDDDTFRTFVADTRTRDLYRGHRAFHGIALAAQDRIDAKKEMASHE